MTDSPRTRALRFFLRHEQPDTEHYVRASLEPVLIETVLDVHGDRVFAGAPDKTRGYLVFVDEAPDANWSHPCRYGLVFEGGGMVVTKHDWPPAEVLDRELIAVSTGMPTPSFATDECPRCDWKGSWDGAICPECGHNTRPLVKA
jgi:hypothetical protein